MGPPTPEFLTKSVRAPAEDRGIAGSSASAAATATARRRRVVAVAKKAADVPKSTWPRSTIVMLSDSSSAAAARASVAAAESRRPLPTRRFGSAGHAARADIAARTGNAVISNSRADAMPRLIDEPATPVERVLDQPAGSRHRVR